MEHLYKITILAERGLRELAQRVCETFAMPDTIIDILPCGIQDVAKRVAEAAASGTDVLVSGSAVAEEITRISKIPVSRIEVSDIDYLFAIIEAFKIGKHPLFVTYQRSPKARLPLIFELLGSSIDCLTFEDEIGLYESIQDSDADVIIGASTACYYAEKLGRKSVLYYISGQTIQQAIIRAHDIAANIREVQSQESITSTIINSAPIGIIVNDTDDRVFYMNTIAKQYTGINEFSPYEKTLQEIAPTLSTKKFMYEAPASLKSYKIFNETRFWTIQAKIINKNAVSGAVTFLSLDNSQKKMISSISRTHGQKIDSLPSGSDASKQLLANIRKYAASDLPLMIFGDYGTEKTFIAECVHTSSNRSQAPLFFINLTGFSENELYNHLLGTASPATQRAGLLNMAHHGTIVFQNLQYAAPAVQACLTSIISISMQIGDIRFITIIDSPSTAPAPEVRLDLFFKLSVLTLQIPPLRERREDIADLFKKSFLGTLSQKQLHFFKNAVFQEILQTYDWPGNQDELNTIAARYSYLLNERPHLSFVAAQTILIELIGETNLFRAILQAYPDADNPRTMPHERLKELVHRLKQLLLYNNTQISEKLNISRTTLWRLISK